MVFLGIQDHGSECPKTIYVVKGNIHILLDLLKGDIYIYTYFAGSLKGAIELFIDLLKGDIYYCWSPQRRHV